MLTCENCIHFEVCDALAKNDIPKVSPRLCGCYKDRSNYIELPCKVGDTVYIIDEDYVESEYPFVLGVKVLMVYVTRNGIAVDLSLPLGFRLNTIAEVGKTVFITKEEAEKALAEREQNNG